VKRLVLGQLVVWCLALASCEGVFVGFVSNPGGTITIDGAVSIVQLGFVQDPSGEKVASTAVTFINTGTATTINFCGDQRVLFPMNHFVRATFTTGVLCSSLISTVVLS
jgi:hypothetical protein